MLQLNHDRGTDQDTPNHTEAQSRPRQQTKTTIDLWPYFRGTHKVYVEDTALKDRIASWQGCRVHCLYYNRHFTLVAWDIIFPARLYNRVAELCGLPPKKKSPRRVAWGRRLGAQAKALGHIGIPQQGDFAIVDCAQTRPERRSGCPRPLKPWSTATRP